MDFSWQIIIFLIIIGIIIGAVGTIAGIGGGGFIVAVLTIFFLLPIDEAIDTSIFIIMISSGVAFITYLRQGRTNLKLSLIFAVFSILGSILCIIFLYFVHINNLLLKFIFASAILIAGLNMLYKAYTTHKKAKSSTELESNEDFSLAEYDFKVNLKKSIPLFMLAGFLAHLLGIGGGMVITPALNIVLGYPIHYATGISTSVIFFTAVFNTLVKAITGKINYAFGLLLAIGSVLGAYLGAKISNIMPRVTLQFFVATTLILLAIRMYF